MHDAADVALVQKILPVLNLDHQCTRPLEAWNHDLVAQLRRCGRQARGRLGHKSRTLISQTPQPLLG